MTTSTAVRPPTGAAWAPSQQLRGGVQRRPLQAARQPVQWRSSARAGCRQRAPLAAAADGHHRRRWRLQAAPAPDGSSHEQQQQTAAAVEPQAAAAQADLLAEAERQRQQQQLHAQQTAAGPAAADVLQQQQDQQQRGGGEQQQPAAPQLPQWAARLIHWPALPAVPWGLNTTLTLMVMWLLTFWLAAYTLVPALLRWAGAEPGGAATQALRHLLLDSLQVGATLALLRRGLAGYHPRALGLFAVPLRPLRAWLPAVAAGLATFPLIDWVHKRMVALLALEEVVASGTAERILGSSSPATQALWFGVLAVAAPIWEELMFRGFLLPSLGRYLPAPAAVAATSLIFALVHFSREGLLPLLLLGCVFGGAYAASRNLLAPIALHSLWNVCLLVQLLRAGGAMP